jgi:hypothetical protein
MYVFMEMTKRMMMDQIKVMYVIMINILFDEETLKLKKQ